MAMASATSTVPKRVACPAAQARPLCAGGSAFFARQLPCRNPAQHVWRSPTRSLVVRAAGDTKPKLDLDLDKIITDLTEKWENVDDKQTVVLYGVGALVLVWLAGSVVNAFGSIPLLPKLFELVGLTYSAWFVYRYLLFKSSREELLKDVDELKQKIAGEDD